MAALMTAILAASLLGSPHCAGMCGPIVAFAVGIDNRRWSQRFWSHAAYHLGRLTTYMLLGAVCGAVGAGLNLGGSLVGLQRIAAVLAGAMMVGFGGAAVLRHFGARLPAVGVPGFLRRAATKAHTKALSWPPLTRATVTGLLTTLLPCGWLYAFAITSAGTGSPLWGALTMAVFWVGTLPVLVGVGVGVQSLAGVFAKRIPLVMSLLIVAVGLFTVFNRAMLPITARAPAVAAPQSVDAAVEQVHEHAAEGATCCEHEP